MKTTVHRRLLVSTLLAVLFGILTVSDASARTSLKAKASAGDAPAGRYFGFSVAVDDDTMVVGDPYESGTLTFSGAAYVFKKSGDTWTQQAKLTPENTRRGPMTYGGFGWAVAVSGETVVVGTSRGFAYVFRFNGTDWGQGEELSGTPGNGFGWAVAMSQARVVVGARASSAYVFRDDGSTCIPEIKGLLTANNPSSDLFGYSVSLIGDIVVVGAPGADSAYVFRFNGTDWGQEAKLSGPQNSGFGSSVALSNETVVVGAPDANVACTYRFDGIAWVGEEPPLQGEDTVAGSQFGYSLAIDGGMLVVGAPYGQDDSGQQSGSAYVWRYDEKGKQWKPTLRPKLIGEGPAANDQFGFAVALKGNRVAVGAPNAGQIGSVSEFSINRPPVAKAATNLEVREGDKVTLDGSASSDPDEGDVLTYHWVQVGFADLDPVSIDHPDPLVPQATFVAPEVPPKGATLTFQLTVNDDEEEASEPVEVSVVVTKAQCQVTSHLGEKRHWIPDRDTFTFQGNKGERVTLTLEAGGSGNANGGRAVLILQDRIRHTWLLRADRGALPNQIQATLPATGQYLVTVMDDPFCRRSARFRGDYVLSLTGASGCLESTRRCLSVKKKVEHRANSCHEKESLIDGFWF